MRSISVRSALAVRACCLNSSPVCMPRKAQQDSPFGPSVGLVVPLPLHRLLLFLFAVAATVAEEGSRCHWALAWAMPWQCIPCILSSRPKA